MYDIAIVGGGAAALFAAANLEGKRVLVLERNAAPGRKLLITGKGKCNLTNCDTPAQFLSRFSKEQARFLQPALMLLPPSETRRWFSEHGLELSCREDGKVFPTKGNARSVLDTLYETARDNGIRFAFGNRVTAIDRKRDGFLIATEHDTYEAHSIILATGGKSHPETGSDGSGYQLASMLGHTIEEPKPALTGIRVEDHRLSSLMGLSIPHARIDCFHGGEARRHARMYGDLLITHDGLSGPAIIDHVRTIEKGDLLACSLLPLEEGQTVPFSLQEIKRYGGKSITSFLKDRKMPLRLIRFVLQKADIDETQACGNLGKRQVIRLFDVIVNHRVTVAARKGFSSAMVTSGGIVLGELNRKTMESRIVDNLYAIGELIDVDGPSGGYNLQVAFSTAYLAITALMTPPR